MPVRIEDYLGDNQIRRAYDASQNEEYFGLGSPAALVSELRWRIIKRAYDANQNEVSVGYPRLNAGASFTDDFIFEWDERANYTYSND